MPDSGAETIPLEALGRDDVGRVDGKNPSLGEMVAYLAAQGVRVPPGFATTADAYWRFVRENDLQETITGTLDELAQEWIQLAAAGRRVREAFLRGTWPQQTAEAIAAAYAELGRRAGARNLDVAVRSSATAEDLPDASFAGQQESFLNIRSAEGLLDACRRCYASLSTDRAISYRQAKGFDHLKVALSVGVQQMVRADRGGAGVMFSIDTETGFEQAFAAFLVECGIDAISVSPDSFAAVKRAVAEAESARCAG